MAAAREASGGAEHREAEPSLEELLKSLNLTEEDTSRISMTTERGGGSEGGHKVYGSDASTILQIFQRGFSKEDDAVCLGYCQRSSVSGSRSWKIHSSGELPWRLATITEQGPWIFAIMASL
jgi:hypothetical protein